ncbi:MAG: sulfite exporter TauE/SafE family protein [Gammaproteobacteria bacterium]|nr:sulfite exporter TauE/SafE family protein [Gammaproteobacteria bacterium]
MLFALLGAVLIGLCLGLLGSGGSILTVPVLLYLVHMPAKLAIACSLGIVGGISLVGALPYAYQRLVRWRFVLLFGLPDMLGAWIGAWAGEFMPGSLQLIIFAIVMLVAAAVMLRDSPPNPEANLRHAGWKIVLSGFGVGLIVGVVGVGGGFLIVPALVILGQLMMRPAVATSLVIIMLASFTGFARNLLSSSAQSLHISWGMIGLFILVGALGSFAGHQISARMPHHQLKRLFGVFLVLMAAYIIWRTLPHVFRARGSLT